MPTISYGSPISSSVHRTRKSRVLPRAILFTRANAYSFSMKRSLPDYAHSPGHVSPSSQKPLPHTGTHAPLALVSQQSVAHELWSSPDSQKPFPHWARHAPDGP